MNAPVKLRREVRLKRFLDLTGSTLVGIALWSIVGSCVALRLDAPDVALDFIYSLVVALTMIAIGYVEGRLDG